MSGGQEESGKRRPAALVTETSMYVPKGARVSFVGEDDAPTDAKVRWGDPEPEPKDRRLKPRTRKLTRSETRTSYVDKAFSSMDSPTHTFRVMSQHDMTARKLFATLDSDGNGCLDPEEVASLSVMLGVEMSKHDVRKAFEEMDDDGNGEISFEEFSRWWQNVRENDRRKVRRQVRNAFHKLDRNNDGTIDKQEFATLMSIRVRKVMNLMGEPFDLERDWALMHRSYVERGGELSDDLLVSFTLFEKWWKYRNGIDDCEVPVIPETMALRINEAVRGPRRHPLPPRPAIAPESMECLLMPCAVRCCDVLHRD